MLLPLLFRSIERAGSQGLSEAFRIDSHANCLKRGVCICSEGMSRVDVGPLCLGSRKVRVTLRELDALIHY